MLQSTVDEVKEAFAAAKNLNAALKNLLKKEGSSSPQIVGFAKDFRNAASSGKSGPRDFFIEKHYPAKELFFMGAVRYAFPELVDATVGAIVEKFADQFNATYERNDDGIKVTNSAGFKKIAKEVHGIITSDLKAAELPTNNFMHNALLATVFEVDVFAEVMKVLD
jgi:ribosomal protein S17E